MSKKILIPLDGSKFGEAALHYVEELISTLSAEQKVEVTLIQIIKPITRQIGVSRGYDRGLDYAERMLTVEEMEAIKKDVMEYLTQAGESLRSRGVTVNSKVIVSKTGASSAEEIIKAEDDIDADLVAMSTHGRRGLGKWVLGSVTEKVLRAGKTPVLVVRAKEKE